MKTARLIGCAILAIGLGSGRLALAADTAAITGKVTFEGTPPKMKKIHTDADPYCAQMHENEPLRSEEVLVGKDGGLQNVFVYVKSGLEGKTYEPPSTPVEVDQKGCQYHPHVFGMMAKQKLKIVNDDATLHNIHAMPNNSKEFNIGQPNEGMSSMKTFANPEIMVHLKCDVHPWMSAYVGVCSNPFYAVSGEDGTFAIKDLPAGTYTIEAWHEKYGTQTQTVKVGEGESKAISFAFKATE